MVEFRKLFDLTPWDKSGNSFMGLTREQSKFLATIFIFTGLFFADPPFSVLPTDFVNIWLAGGISTQFGISFESALLLTYTVFAWGLIFFGVWIYPYDSRRLLSGYITRFKKILRRVMRNPIYVIISLSLFYLLYQWYKQALGEAQPLSLSGLQILLTEPTNKTILFVVGIIAVMSYLKERS